VHKLNNEYSSNENAVIISTQIRKHQIRLTGP